MSEYNWHYQLHADEALLWNGSPSTRLELFQSMIDYFVVPVTSIWCLSALVSLAGSLPQIASSGVSLDFLSLAIILPMGLRVAVGRALRDRAIRKRLAYAITSKRVLRVDAVTDECLTEMLISPSLEIDAAFGQQTTIRLHTSQKSSLIPYAKEPAVHWPQGLIPLPAKIIFDFAAPFVSTLFNGYRERGLELRFLPNGKEVTRLLKTLKQDEMEGQPV